MDVRSVAMLNRSAPRAQRAVIGLSVLFCATLGFASELVPAPLRSAIIVRSAGYERGFAARSGEAVLAVVLGKSGAPAEDGHAMVTVFTKLLKETQISGRRTRVVQLTFDTAAKTVDELRSQRAEIVYFSSGLENIVKSVPGSEGGIRRILVCANGGDVAEGCTLGVERDGERPRLVLNLKQANASGLRFDPGLLRLVRIVR
jgi:hypothetical protein